MHKSFSRFSSHDPIIRSDTKRMKSKFVFCNFFKSLFIDLRIDRLI